MKKLTVFLFLILALMATALFASPISTAGECPLSDQVIVLNEPALEVADFKSVAAPATVEAINQNYLNSGINASVNSDIERACTNESSRPTMLSYEQMRSRTVDGYGLTEKRQPRARARDVQ